jgi:hypothetical protein
MIKIKLFKKINKIFKKTKIKIKKIKSLINKMETTLHFESLNIRVSDNVKK